MGTKFRGSKTEQILINAFAGESQARNRYTYYSKIAKKEGYEQISEIFLMTAENELEHAKLFFKHIENNPYGHVDAFYPFVMGNTLENLKYAIEGEEEEYKVLYLNGEKVALDEGFDSVASTFKHVRNAEEHHAKRFQILYEHLKNDTIFKKETDQKWICRKCGYIYIGEKAPDYCPNCYHSKSYFQLLCETF